MLGGLTLAVALAILSVARVSSDGLSYRSDEVWQSTTTLLLTRKGNTFAAPTAYSPLTDLYSQLANSDAVRRSMLKAGAHKDWKITATPVAPTFNPGAVLPVISLAGEAPTPRDAVKATVLGRQAFLNYVSRAEGIRRHSGSPERDEADLGCAAQQDASDHRVSRHAERNDRTGVHPRERSARSCDGARHSTGEAGRDREQSAAVALTSHSSR